MDGGTGMSLSDGDAAKARYEESKRILREHEVQVTNYLHEQYRLLAETLLASDLPSIKATNLVRKADEVGIDWALTRTGCPRCAAKRVSYHSQTWWCNDCGLAQNWDTYWERGGMSQWGDGPKVELIDEAVPETGNADDSG